MNGPEVFADWKAVRHGPIAAWVSGDGPPLLLLHGYPQTHVMWHAVAPELTRTHTVVAADLRGYGASERPPDGYDKRTMAADQVALMASLGYERFAVVGHDRGARVTHRMCLDRPDAVERAAVLDIVPTRHVFAHADRELGLAYYHWFFLTQPRGLPERLIGADPDYWIRYHLEAWSRRHDAFDAAAVEAYVAAFDAEGIRASCDDYRAGATVDLDHDEASFGTRITCPLLVMWGEGGFVGRHYDVPAVWAGYATDVRTAAVDCGHFLPEERPAETLAALRDFLAVR